MKKLFFLFITIIFVTVNSQAQDKWTSYTSDLGKFSIATIGIVDENTKEDEDKITYKINFTNGSMNYLMSSVNHHSDLEEFVDDLLSVSLNAFTEAVKGTRENEEDFYLGNVKGKYAVIIFQEETIRLEYYTYIKGSYQYQLAIYSEKDSYDQEEADLVNISFRVLD